MVVSLHPLNRGVEQLVARRAHNPKVVGSSPASATIKTFDFQQSRVFFCPKFPFTADLFGFLC